MSYFLCLWLDVCAKHNGKACLEMHLLVDTAAFLSPSSPPGRLMVPGPRRKGAHKAEEPTSKTWTNFLLHPLHHSPQPLQLTGFFCLSSKGANSRLSFLQICLLSETQELSPPFYVHLSHQMTTRWITQVYGELCISPGLCPWQKEMGWEDFGCGASCRAPARKSCVYQKCLLRRDYHPSSREAFSNNLGYCLQIELLGCCPSPGYCFYLYISFFWLLDNRR